MVLVPSTMARLGMPAPDFELPDVVSGRLYTLSSFRAGKALLVMFISRHCPYVKHVQQEIARLGNEYQDKGAAVVAVSSNDSASYPDDSPANLKRLAGELGFRFPVCFDDAQETAKAYTAACTPDFFLFDASRALVYRGQLDDSRPGNGKPVTGKDLRTALDAVLAGKTAPPEQKPSIGCNIKWKEGNEPAYFASK